jgi:ABC-2 type transport system permease protein
MSTQSNALPESFGSPRVQTAALSTRPFFWSLRRELWENKYVYLAPLWSGGIILFVFLVSLIRMPHRLQALSALDPVKQRDLIAAPYDYAAAFLMGVQMLVAIFYSLDCLYGERRDRSILFWKSLPVSDTTTILSKAVVPLAVVPLVTCAVSVATLWIMLLLNRAMLPSSGQTFALVWTQLALAEVSGLLIYHLLAIHALWHAPFYGWFMAISSWARRAPLLWAFVPPLAIIALEKILFGTSYFAKLLGDRLGGGAEGVSHSDMPIDPGMHLTPGKFLTSSGLWTGLAFTAICLFIAMRMRRYRGPS